MVDCDCMKNYAAHERCESLVTLTAALRKIFCFDFGFDFSGALSPGPAHAFYLTFSRVSDGIPSGNDSDHVGIWVFACE